ncbi:MAG: hypothetical protein WEB63_10440 [Cucumibacter sp.]
MPGRKWYLVAIAVFLIGAAGAGLFLVPQVQEIQGRLTRVVVPGEAILSLDAPGSYTIFHEAQSVVDGALFNAGDISGLTVAVRVVSDNRGIPLAQPGVTASYTFGDRAGTSIFTFEIAEPGDYSLTASYAKGQNGPRTVLAVGQGVVGDLVAAIFGALGIGFGAFAVAVAIALTTYLKRRSAARAAAAPSSP